MRLSWPALLSNMRNASVRAQRPSEDHTFLPTFQSVMFHSLSIVVSLQVQGPGWTPTAPTQGAVSIPDEDFILWLCKAQFSSWFLPPAWARAHLIPWPGRESGADLKERNSGPRGQMDKISETKWGEEQWTPKCHVTKGGWHLVLPSWLLPMGT